MKPSTREARERFHAAQAARRRDLRSAALAAALVEARAALDQAVAAVAARVPYGVRPVAELRPGRDGGHVHLAVREPVRMGGFHRERGQTLCGEVPGRVAQDRPVSCDACLAVLDRHVDLEQDPPTLL